MGLTALLRNLRNMAKDGYLVQGSEAVKTVRNRLLNETDIRRSRIHPAHVFLAKFNAENIPVAIQNALEETFFASFGNVEPTNLNLMLALDVSGSMSGGGYSFHYGREARTPTPREWSALQAMVTARVEPFAEFRAFSNTFMPLNITARDSMEDVLRKISGLPFQGTDCSLPMLFARAEKAKFDGFAVYTDNETWARGTTYKGVRSSGNAMQELRAYRQSSGINAKLAVVGITSTQFSIADPNDRGSLDFVGFDADAPAIMADFFRG
jgi:60 kDa SS-A/Ro ribonucleoprotein